MTIEEVKEFLDNLKVCIEEHPIVADWLVEIANRKTAPQTINYCDICNHKGCDNCIADGSSPYCVPSRYEPKTEPQTKCYLRTSCNHYEDKQVCGRCREYNLYSHTNNE